VSIPTCLHLLRASLRECTSRMIYKNDRIGSVHQFPVVFQNLDKSLPSTMALGDVAMSKLAGINAGVIAATVFGGLLTYSIGLAIYRAFFHPLAKVPGPWLAAVTQWYETYYELVPNGGGMFTKRIKMMHERYGASSETRSTNTCSIYLTSRHCRRSHRPHQSQRGPHRRPGVLRNHLRAFPALR